MYRASFTFVHTCNQSYALFSLEWKLHAIFNFGKMSYREYIVGGIQPCWDEVKATSFSAMLDLIKYFQEGFFLEAHLAAWIDWSWLIAINLWRNVFVATRGFYLRGEFFARKMRKVVGVEVNAADRDSVLPSIMRAMTNWAQKRPPTKSDLPSLSH